jgi:hypothetical protein
MIINESKYAHYPTILVMVPIIGRHLHFQSLHFNEGIKYLGFKLKLNNYVKNDWLWLAEKVEKRITQWCNRWLFGIG